MADTILTRLRLMGQRAYVSGVKEASGAVHGLGTESEGTERRVAKSSRGTGLAVAGVGSAALGAATAFATVTGAAAYLGLGLCD